MADLTHSSWAPRSRDAHRSTNNSRPMWPVASAPTLSPASTSVPPTGSHNVAMNNPHASSAMYKRLHRRLEWKCHMLSYSHAIASEATQSQSEGASDAEAALSQFQLDFFELYALLERTLLHLLSTFGVNISRSGARGILADRSWRTEQGFVADRSASQAAPQGAQPTNGAGMGGSASHAFHMHVLQAFDDPELPLHDLFGRGEVREWLGWAKEVRNCWKDAGDGVESGNKEIAANGGGNGRRKAGLPNWLPMIEGVNSDALVTGDDGEEMSIPSKTAMERMMGCILAALADAVALVEARMKASESTTKSPNGGVRRNEDLQIAMELDIDDDTPYEIIADEMELG